MERITYTNGAGESIVIATDSPVYRLKSFLSKPVRHNVLTSKGYRQDGETYETSNAEPRDLLLSFIIFGNGFDDQYEKRFGIKGIMAPELSPGTLRYHNDYFTEGVEITVKIEEEPSFGSGKDFGRHTQICAVIATAYNPYWHDIDYTEVELVGVTGGFYWEEPTYFDGSFYMGEISSASKLVTNGGHVPAPLIVEWQGESENPKIMLEDTGDFILLSETLGDDIKLIINTAYGNKTVYVETISTGEQVKNNSLIDPTSKFFSLPRGNSTLSLSADSGAAAAAVKIKYKNLYSGVV